MEQRFEYIKEHGKPIRGKLRKEKSVKRGKQVNEFSTQRTPLTNQQVHRLLDSVGKWFFVKYFEEVYAGKSDKQRLIDKLFQEGHDKDIAGTTTRVSCMVRLINNGYAHDALEIVAKSKRLLKDHPETSALLRDIYVSHPEIETMRGAC